MLSHENLRNISGPGGNLQEVTEEATPDEIGIQSGPSLEESERLEPPESDSSEPRIIGWESIGEPGMKAGK